MIIRKTNKHYYIGKNRVTLKRIKELIEMGHDIVVYKEYQNITAQTMLSVMYFHMKNEFTDVELQNFILRKEIPKKDNFLSKILKWLE